MPTAREMVRSNVIVAILVVTAVILISVTLLERASYQMNVYRVIVLLLFVVPGCLLPFMLLSTARKATKCEDDLVVTDGGIQLHWRPLSKASRGEHNFLPFEDITAVFPNLNMNLPYITLLLTDGRRIEIDKAHVEDLLAFVSQLSRRTRIETGRDLLLLNKERWYVRCRSE